VGPSTPDGRGIAAGGDRRDDPRVIHRSRRHLATLPARRGMRASWLRRRMPDEMDAGAEAAARPAAPAGEPAEGSPAPGSPGSPGDGEPAASTMPAVARAPFGHPTF
jgi:hypothetical protein